jgi:hypothetical protein
MPTTGRSSLRGAAVFLLAWMPTQAPAQVPRPDGRYPQGPAGAMYGTAEPHTLDEIVTEGQSYQKRNVLTRGYLEPLVTEYFILNDAGSQVLVIPMYGTSEVLRGLLGRRIEVTGVVRVLPVKQEYHPACGIDSKCDDPELPELPNARTEWPRVSLTVLTAIDIAPLDPGRRNAPSTTLEDLRTDPRALQGKTITVLGVFRGRNLYGDLASASPDPSAWVLKARGASVWVIGRKPEGKGFRLDPHYNRDTTRWLEVTGRVVMVAGEPCLKASKVALASPPATIQE